MALEGLLDSAVDYVPRSRERSTTKPAELLSYYPGTDMARVVEVELNKPPLGKPLVTTGARSAEGESEERQGGFENGYVRVLRCKYVANVREPLHEHVSEGRLTVALDDVVLKVTTQGARTAQ